MKCSPWCLATKIYLFLAILHIALSIYIHPHLDENTVSTNIYSIVLTLIWFCIIAWLCSVCYNKTALALVLLPYLIGTILFTFVFIILTGFSNKLK